MSRMNPPDTAVAGTVPEPVGDCISKLATPVTPKALIATGHCTWGSLARLPELYGGPSTLMVPEPAQASVVVIDSAPTAAPSPANSFLACIVLPPSLGDEVATVQPLF